jgi:hypothetical protein
VAERVDLPRRLGVGCRAKLLLDVTLAEGRLCSVRRKTELTESSNIRKDQCVHSTDRHAVPAHSRSIMSMYPGAASSCMHQPPLMNVSWPFATSSLNAACVDPSCSAHQRCTHEVGSNGALRKDAEARVELDEARGVGIDRSALLG